jgi:long-subunit acyl-CoA synthetase (AMP-forming)
MSYFKDPENTAKAMDNFGVFDTGDLGRINPAKGDLILTGRELSQGYYCSLEWRKYQAISNGR